MSLKWNKRLYWIEELDQRANDFVGKKCANLGEMADLGLPVPEGFALSLEACRTFLEETGATEEILKCIEPINHMENIGTDSKTDIEFRKKIEEISNEIQEIIVSREIPDNLKNEICRYYTELCDRCGQPELPVAVRSSGVLSMPGQMETFLNIRGEQEVLSHVVRVWASAFTPRAISWRLKHEDMDVTDSNIGVAVLQMVDAECAGVGFTANPATGEDSRVIIEGNWGFGESIVQGMVTPDTYEIVKDGFQVNCCTIGEKTKFCSSLECGTEFTEVPREKQKVLCLEERQAIELARMACLLEKHFTGPQDFEWAMDKRTRKVFMVQVRPAKHIPQKRSDTDKLLDLVMSRF